MGWLQKEVKEQGPFTSYLVNLNVFQWTNKLGTNPTPMVHSEEEFRKTHFDPEDVLELLGDRLERRHEALALHVAEEEQLQGVAVEDGDAAAANLLGRVFDLGVPDVHYAAARFNRNFFRHEF